MNTIESQSVYNSVEQSALKRAAGGWFAESTGAIAALVFSLAGLAGIRPITMAGIATIVIGASILIEGGAFASVFAGLVSTFRREGRALEWRGVIAAEFLGGLAGIVLGILALVGIAPLTLLAI